MENYVEIERQGAMECFYDMPMEVNWALTDMCNYHCSYCFGQKRIGESEFASMDDIKNAIDNIAALGRPRYNFVLGGGEPTIHPNFLNLIKYAHEVLGDRLDNFLIISNGSRDVKFYHNLVNVSKEVNLNLSISIHTDHVKLNHIIELIKVASKDMYLTFSLMFNPAKRGFVKEIYTALKELRKEYPFHMSIVTLREAPKFDRIDKRYNNEDFLWQRNANIGFQEICREYPSDISFRSKYIRHNFHEVIRNGSYEIITNKGRQQLFKEGLMRFKGMYCINGTYIMNILANGDCRGLVCGATKIKYNIFRENPYLKDANYISPVFCSYENCGCSANDPVPKFKDKKEADLFCKIAREKQIRIMDLQ